MPAAIAAAIALLPVLGDTIGRLTTYLRNSGHLTPEQMEDLVTDVHSRADPADGELANRAEAAQKRIDAARLTGG